MTTFALRPIIWSDGYSRPDDYYIVHEGQIVGRICRMNNVAKDRWCWTRIGPLATRHGSKGGIVNSLDEAKAAFRTAWERRVQEPQLPASQPKSRATSISWADKFALALLAITAIVAAILALNPRVYRTTPESIGAGIGLFVVMAVGFVLPPWLILRIGIWAARVLRTQEA
jgi:hypothetical protein